MTKEEIATAIANLGGIAFLVGGAVRDSVMGRSVHDEDIVITGVSEKAFTAVFPNAVQTGKLFPVWRIGEFEVALARREKKSGKGHNGFSVEFGPEVSIEDDLRRRDLTINAMARNLLTGELVDPYGGQEDIKSKTLREVDAVAFREDPLRVLRAARFFASFDGFSIAPSLKEAMGDGELLKEVAELPCERVWGEMEKALMTSTPSRFFEALAETGALRVVFPEVDALRGQIQPEQWHPEGDAFVHSIMVLDAIAQAGGDLEARFAGLCHDLGKGVTPKELLPKHHGHDAAGARIISAWRDGRFPKRLKMVAEVIARFHMRAHAIEKEFEKGNVPINGMFNVLEAISRKRCVEAYKMVCTADRSDVSWVERGLSSFGSLNPDEIPQKGDIRSQVIAIRKRRLKAAFA